MKALLPPLSFLAPVLTISVWLWSLLSLVGLVMVVFILLDMRARWRDYQHLLTWFKTAHSSSQDYRKLRRYRSSRCQRHVAITAARASSHLGLQQDVKDYYYGLGYRWWHVLPDNTFSLKSPYFRRAFYKTLIYGTKHAAKEAAKQRD